MTDGMFKYQMLSFLPKELVSGDTWNTARLSPPTPLSPWRTPSNDTMSAWCPNTGGLGGSTAKNEWCGMTGGLGGSTAKSEWCGVTGGLGGSTAKKGGWCSATGGLGGSTAKSEWCGVTGGLGKKDDNGGWGW